MIDLSRRKGEPFAWFVFGGYVGTIFALTHWPRLSIAIGVPRPDLLIHLIVFFLWTLLLAVCRPAGPLLSGRNTRWTAGIAIVYAVFDELTQGIPGINRAVGIDDLAANIAGIGIAVAALLIARRAALGRSRGRPHTYPTAASAET